MTKFFISCKESRIENNRSFYGCFYLGPFDAGQSITVANALRRTLLSSLKGIGITSVQIENAYHEYSTLTGVRDSVLDILLNLKEIVLKKTNSKALRFTYTNRSTGDKKHVESHIETNVPNLFYGQPRSAQSVSELNESFYSLKRPQVGYLRARGPGVIKAKDLRLPPFIHCVDPEQYIATLAEDGVLNMKFLIQEGDQTEQHGSNLSVTQERAHKVNRNSSQSYGTYQDYSTRISNINNANTPANDLEYFTLKNRKRRLLLKTIKHELNNASVNRDKNTIVSNNNVSDNRNLTSEYTSASTRGRSSRLSAKWRENPEWLCNGASSGPLTQFNPLKIDTVFNPITKVNYIIEVSDSKVVNSSFEKGKWLSKLESLINGYSFEMDSLCTGEHSEHATRKPILNINEPNWIQTNKESVANSFSQADEQSGLGSIRYNGSLTELDTWTEISSLYSNQTASPKQNIILEIWTNGSIHPRDAFFISFKHLIRLFRTLVICANVSKQTSNF